LYRPTGKPVKMERGSAVTYNRAVLAFGLFCLTLSVFTIFQKKDFMTGASIFMTESVSLKTVEQERARNELLAGQLLQYEEELDRYREDLLETNRYVKSLQAQLDKAKLLAGLTDVEGPGVIVVMRDGVDQIIHDKDLLMVLNELKDAGAEALSLNGQRIVATSEVRCAGSIVSVNNVRCGTPFTIYAIGDAQTLFNALFLNGGVVDSLEQWGLSVTVETCDKISIASYNTENGFLYAKEPETQ